MDWAKPFMKQYGLVGALVVVILILVAQNANLLPGLHEVAAGGERLGPPPPPAATAEQLRQHTDEARVQTDILKEVLSQLKQNRETQAVGARLNCIRLSKTDSQRDECAKIP